MDNKTAVSLSIGIITATLTAFAFAKKKPHITMAIMGSLGAFSLIYNLLIKEEVDIIRTQMEMI